MDIRRALDGIKSVYKMDLTTDPKQIIFRMRNTPDVLDIMECMEYVRDMFGETEGYVGKKLKRGNRKRKTKFTYVDDIKNMLHEIYLSDVDPKKAANKRFRNKALFYLVIDPLLECFRDVKHETAMEIYNDVVDDVIKFAKTDNTQCNPADDFIIRRMVAKA